MISGPDRDNDQSSAAKCQDQIAKDALLPVLCEIIAKEQIERINRGYMDIEATVDPRTAKQNQYGAENDIDDQQILHLSFGRMTCNDPVYRKQQIQTDQTVQIPDMRPRSLAGEDGDERLPDSFEGERAAVKNHLIQHVDETEDDEREQHTPDILGVNLADCHLTRRIEQERAGDHDKTWNRPHHQALQRNIDDRGRLCQARSMDTDASVNRMQQYDRNAGDRPQPGICIDSAGTHILSHYSALTPSAKSQISGDPL